VQVQVPCLFPSPVPARPLISEAPYRLPRTTALPSSQGPQPTLPGRSFPCTRPIWSFLAIQRVEPGQSQNFRGPTRTVPSRDLAPWSLLTQTPPLAPEHLSRPSLPPPHHALSDSRCVVGRSPVAVPSPSCRLPSNHRPCSFCAVLPDISCFCGYLPNASRRTEPPLPLISRPINHRTDSTVFLRNKDSTGSCSTSFACGFLFALLAS
jgi:hypothetical protein